MNDLNQPDGGGVNGEEPLEITTFYPRKIEVVDPRWRSDPGSDYFRRSVRSNNRVALVLFVATCISVFLAGTTPSYGMLTSLNDVNNRGLFSGVLGPMLHNGAVFFAAVMTILVAHEMGHYLQARRYRVPASVPYFIPFPISPFGTMGAVIIQGAGVADRKSLFDIAISGPLAGLVFALPISIIGIHEAQLVYRDPALELTYSDPLVLQWLTHLIHGPIPENMMLQINSWLFAGWVGIFITALNLVPIGQLDGGHILYTLIGRRAHRVAVALLAAALAFMLLSSRYSYAFMVVLLIVAGPRHPPTADDNVPLGRIRTLLGWATLAFVIIGFTPVPMTVTEIQRPEAQHPEKPEIDRDQDAPDRKEHADEAEGLDVRLAPVRTTTLIRYVDLNSRSSGSS